MTEETEVLETPNLGIVPEVEVSPERKPEYSFNEYTQQISEDLVVTTYGDSKVVDKSGPFDNLENAQAFAASLLDALKSGELKPNYLVVEGY